MWGSHASNSALRVLWGTSWALDTGWVCARGEIGVVQQRADVELAPETDNTQLACNQTTYTWHATDNIHLAYDSNG